MTLTFTQHAIRRALVTALALTLAGGASAPATAAALPGPTDREREVVLERAKRWTKHGVPYSQARYHEGYRTDCSGFVSMAWGLDESLTTRSLPEVSRRIDKDMLKPGDIMLNGSGDSLRHAVIFGGWADQDKTTYVALEQTGQSGVDRAVKRVVPYPYRFQGEKYKPYRLDGPLGPEAAVQAEAAEEAARAAASKAAAEAAEEKAAADATREADAGLAREAAKLASGTAHAVAQTPTLLARLTGILP
ncbi:MAG: hypothetical protein IBX62_04665 [Coriobacteriia bacterium]|nr:hypothetical protein [Coriobacteriia bacterium]